MYLRIDEDDDMSTGPLLLISSDEPMHRLAWLMNKHLQTDFRRADTHVVSIKKTRVEFETMVQNDPDSERTIHLIANNSEGIPLLKDWAAFDYIMKIDNPDPEDRDLQRKIKQLPGVRAIISDPAVKQKDRLNLVIDENTTEKN
jgi:hypothetical protein